MPRHIFGNNGNLENGGLTYQNKFLGAFIYNFNIYKFSNKLTFRVDNFDQFADIGSFGYNIYVRTLNVVDTNFYDKIKVGRYLKDPNLSYYRFGGNIYQLEFQSAYQIDKLFNFNFGIAYETRISKHLADLYDDRNGLLLFGGSTKDNSYNKNYIINTDYGAYIQISGRTDFNFGYVFGLRANHLSVSKQTTLTPRLGFVYNHSKEFNLKLLYGEAFRSPGPHEQYYKVPLLIYGPDILNKNLKPEKIKTSELLVESNILDKVNLKANVYYNTINNIIARRPATSSELLMIDPSGKITSTLVYDNLGSQNIYGLEFEFLSIITKEIKFFGNFTLKNGNQKKKLPNGKDTTFNIIPYMEKITFNSGITFNYSNFILTPYIQFIGERDGFLASDTYYKYKKSIPAYSLLNLNLIYKLSDDLKITLSLFNILNKEYFYPELVRNEFIAKEGVPRSKVLELDPIKIPGGPGFNMKFGITYNF